MGVIVKGTQTIYGVSIEIDEDEVIKALWTTAGLSEVNSSVYEDIYWKRETDKLVEMEDISYHGSPCWKPTKREITDPIKLKLYDQIIELIHTLKEQEETDDSQNN